VSDQYTCAERERLSSALDTAAGLVHKIKINQSRVIQKGEPDISRLFEPIAKAREAARKAAKALEAHRNQHGC
jgi:hypothetical protein